MLNDRKERRLVWRAHDWRALGLISPTWLVLGGLFILPLLILFWLSFHQADDLGNGQQIEHWRAYWTSSLPWSNYKETLESIYVRVHLRSLWLAIVTTALCLAIGYPIAYYIAVTAPARWKNLLLALVVVPFWTSFLIRVAAWRLILQDHGVINLILERMHVISTPLQMLDTPLAVMIGLVYGELPFMILPLYASLEKLDRSLLDAASDLGARPAAAFMRVTVPLTMPGIIAGIVLVFIPGIGQFIVSDMLGGARTELIGNMIQEQFTSGRDKPLGAALAFELMAMVLVILVTYAVYARRHGGGAAL